MSGPTQTTMLVNQAHAAELFHNPAGDAYASFPVGSHVETWALTSKGFRRWLRREYFARFRTAPHDRALHEAIEILEAHAVYDGAEHQVFTRVGTATGTIVLDLCNAEWQTVEVTAQGWHLSQGTVLKFRRAHGMMALPLPQPAGSLAELQPFLNVSVSDWPLIVAFLLAALRGRGPFPVLNLIADQGAGKSTAARVLKALVDPSAAPVRAEPREPHDLVISAGNSWMLAYDNLSHLPAWLSDGICRLATGGGFATRQLFTDAEEIIFDAQRPVILNGIGDLASRGDLLERSIIVDLPTISEKQRRPERDLWQAFEEAQPRILGALLVGVATGLANQDTVNLEGLPRMADFAVWITACEPALGWPEGTFALAYERNRKSAHEVALEASPIVPFVRQLSEMRWTGTATELLTALTDKDNPVRRQRGWPGTARALTNELRRLRPNLRAAGVEVEMGEHHREAQTGRRLITLQRTGKGPSPPSPQSRANSGTVTQHGPVVTEPTSSNGHSRVQGDPSDRGDRGDAENPLAADDDYDLASLNAAGAPLPEDIEP